MYWSRQLLKDNARKVLANSYWRVFLVCLITGILTGGGARAKTNFDLSRNTYNSYSGYYDDFRFGFNQFYNYGLFSGVLFAVFLVVLVFAICWSVFIANPITVGSNRYLMENRAGFPPVTSMFSTFKGKEQYLNIVKVMFQMRLEIFLWSLLCLIPGIYKSYQYYYIPYLLAENPYMSYSRAKELSIAMTDGEKMEIFVLELSFIGWYFLGALACGVGTLFVTPYAASTYAELYAAARAKAFSLGITGPDELADFTRY